MGTFILIAIGLFFVGALIATILNKKKERNYETAFSDEVIKTKKVYKGSLSRYVDSKEGKTILRYFVGGKTNTLTDFVPTDEILVNNCLVMFDETRKRIAIINYIRKHGVAKTMQFEDVVSLQPVEISKTKKVTRGGISPIAIAGYYWSSSTTKMLKQVERVYIEIKYKAYNKEHVYEIPIFDGKSYSDENGYAKIVTKVNTVINKFHDVINKK